MRLLKQILVFLFCVNTFTALSQDTAFDVSAFDSYRKIASKLLAYDKASHDADPAGLPLTEFTVYKTNSLSQTNYSKPRWFYFKLSYNGDERQKTIYFYPGKMVNTNVYIYDSVASAWTKIDQRQAFSAISLSSKITLTPITLQQGIVQHILIKPELHYYNWTQWKPAISTYSAVNDLILQEFIRPNYTYSILTILMAGMMFMLFSYSILKFYLNRRNEYLYNCLFAFAFLLFFTVVFINSYYYHAWWHSYSAFFQKWLQMFGYAIQLVFIISFLELRNRKPKLFSFLRAVIIGLIAYCCVLPLISFSDQLYPFNTLLFNVVGFVLLGVGLYTAIVLHKWNRFSSRYVSFGLFALIAFLILIILQNTLLKEKQYLVQKIGGWVILYHLGILANVFFFRLGLGQKERKQELKNLDDIEKLKLENEKKELEKVLAIASSRIDERNRIAKEIHDDIGSGLTSIRLLSEIAMVKKENKDELNKISANANDLVNNLNEIIWSINSKNDTIPNLLAYIRSHMVDYLEPYDIKLSINIPPDIPNVEISGENRRNIFMVVKECFTNIAKHANASAVNFTVQIRDQLIFTIKDNGKGFDSNDILPFKNGIRNMKERIEHVGGEMEIWGKNGTTITIKIPITRTAANL